MTDLDIERMIKMFQTGVIRRCGVRCDAVVCGEVMAMLKELQKRRMINNGQEKLVADRDYQGLDLLHVEAEWRPNND